MFESLLGWGITIGVLIGILYHRFPHETWKAYSIGKQVLSILNQWRKGR